MKYLSLLIVVFALSNTACEGTIELGEDTVMPALPAAAGGKADSLGTPEVTMDGGALYQQYCASCHGTDATGGRLYDQSILGATPIDSIVLNGIGTMPAMPLAAAEITAIEGFLNSGTTSTTPPPVVNDGTTPALQVYASECASCHGAEGLGTDIGPALRLRDDGLMRFVVRQGRNGAGIPSNMPTYDTSAVTDAQLEDMIDWLDAFPNPTTGEGLYNQYCSTCHGVDGTGGTSFEAVAGTLRAQTIIRNGHGGSDYAQRDTYMTAWTADQISDAEIVLIEQWMRQL